MDVGKLKVNNIYKLLIMIVCMFLGVDSYSQNEIDEAQNVVIDWEVGTSKNITQIDSTVIYDNDSIFMSSEIKAHYTIKILSQKDTIYEVLFKQIVLDDNVWMESEMMNVTPVEQALQALITEFQKKISGFEYSFLVSQNTAFAYKVVNEKEVEDLVEEMVIIFLNKYLDEAKIELDENEKNEFQLQVKAYLNEQMPAALQTMLNKFNYIFQAYSFPFILNETYTEDIQVYDVDQIKYGDRETEAKLIVSSKLVGSELMIDYEYIYNKEEVYQIYVVDKGDADEIPIEEFDIIERIESMFDIDSSWIKSSTSFVKAKIGDLSVNNITQVIIE